MTKIDTQLVLTVYSNLWGEKERKKKKIKMFETYKLINFLPYVSYVATNT